MPFLLRKIKKSRWLERTLNWLVKEDIPADPLGDLATQDNKLSVWLVDEDKSNLERIAVALAANCPKIANLDYVLFNQALVRRLDIEFEKSHGGTPDDYANRNWHYDLVKLSGRKLLELAREVLTESELKRLLRKEVARLVEDGLSSGELAPKMVQDKIKQSSQ